MIEICRIGRRRYHLEAATELPAILFNSPMIFARPPNTHTGMMRQEAVSDKLNYLGSLFTIKDECLYHWIRVERSDGCSTLIVDVFFNLAHCL